MELFKAKPDPELAVPPKELPLTVPPFPNADDGCEAPAVPPKLPKRFALDAAGVPLPDPNGLAGVFLVFEVDCPKIPGAPDPPLVGVVPKEKVGVDFGGSDIIGDSLDGRGQSLDGTVDSQLWLQVFSRFLYHHIRLYASEVLTCGENAGRTVFRTYSLGTRSTLAD